MSLVADVRPSPPKFVRHLAKVMKAIIGVALVLWILIQGSRLLMLMFAGVLFGIYLRRCALFFNRHFRVKTNIGVIAVLLLTLIGVGLFGFFAGRELATELSQLRQTIPAALNELKSGLGSSATLTALARSLQEHLAESTFSGKYLVKLTGLASLAASYLTDFGIFVVFGAYFAVEPNTYFFGLIRLFPVHSRGHVAAVLSETGTTLSSWLIAQLCSSSFIGIVTGLALGLVGLPLAFLLGVLAALFTLIPTIGPALAALSGMLVALVNGSIRSAILVGLIYWGVQIVENYVFTPMVNRRAIKVPPALGFAVLLLMGLIAGGFGMMLAAPIAAAGLVLIKRFYIEDLLGDKLVEAPRSS